MNIKPGDEVQVEWNDNGGSAYIGLKGVVLSINNTDGAHPIKVKLSTGQIVNFCPPELGFYHNLGDRFKTKYQPSSYEGSVLEIISVLKNRLYPYTVRVVEKGTGAVSVGQRFDWKDDLNGDMQIINNNKNNMSKVGIMMKKLLDKDTQTLVKAGFINGDLELTTEGKIALDALHFQDKKADLVVLAQEKIDEEKADRGCEK